VKDIEGLTTSHAPLCNTGAGKVPQDDWNKGFYQIDWSYAMNIIPWLSNHHGKNRKCCRFIRKPLNDEMKILVIVGSTV
jgi:hypothetical protein